MNIKIKETGKLETLVIIDRKSGMNWVSDLIGNTGALNDGQFVWSEGDDAYIAEQETYDWWGRYISDVEQTDHDVETLADNLGVEQEIIWERISKDSGNDYDDHRPNAIRTMEEIKGEQE